MSIALRTAITFWITMRTVATTRTPVTAMRRIFLSTWSCSPPNQIRSRMMTSRRRRVVPPFVIAASTFIGAFLFERVDHALGRGPEERGQQDEQQDDQEAARGGHEPRGEVLHDARQRVRRLPARREAARPGRGGGPAHLPQHRVHQDLL